MRDELWKAYVEAYGVPQGYAEDRVLHSMHDRRLTEEETREQLDKTVRTFPDSVVEEYTTHGLAYIRLLGISVYNTPDSLIIDTDLLSKIKPPAEVWVYRFRGASLHLMFSSGKQHVEPREGKKFLKFDNTKRLEGLMVDFDFKNVSPTAQIPYTVELTPLYKPTQS